EPRDDFRALVRLVVLLNLARDGHPEEQGVLAALDVTPETLPAEERIDRAGRDPARRALERGEHLIRQAVAVERGIGFGNLAWLGHRTLEQRCERRAIETGGGRRRPLSDLAVGPGDHDRASRRSTGVVIVSEIAASTSPASR